MTLHNTEYHITFSSQAGRFYYYFAKDDTGWYQVTSAGSRHQATAEQVLNHLLPALADVKPGVKVSVEYVPEASSPNSAR